METTTTVPAHPEPARPSVRSALGAALRRSWVPVPGVTVMVAAWWSDASGWYVAGLALVVGCLVVALRRHRAVAAVTAVLALLAGLAGPWLGIRQAYEPLGVAVTGDARSGSGYVTSAGDLVVLAHDRTVLAVDGSGAQAWEVDVPRLVHVWPLPGGRLVARSGNELVALSGETGAELWTRPLSSARELVALSPEVLVARSCTDVALSACTWTGLDVADGTVVWESTGAWAPGWPVTSRDSTSPDQVRSVDTSVFTVAGQDGQIELREASTGRTVQVVDGTGASPALLGDAALVFRTAGPCTVELVRATGPAWTSEYPCALRRPPVYPYEPGGTHVGDAFWGEPVEGRGTLAIDLRDGTVREESDARKEGAYGFGTEPVHVLGAGVDAQVDRDGVVVRDPADGTVRWELDPPYGEISTLAAGGDVVVVTRRGRPLLLREWWGPDHASEDVTEVYDAATGELRAAARSRYWGPSPLPLDDRVLTVVPDVTGAGTLRILGG